MITASGETETMQEANPTDAAPDRRVMTRLGMLFDVDAPRAEDVRIFDVAHHLARECRFGGATSEFYSVAEHCCRVAGRLSYLGLPPSVQLQGLLHDGAEAYVGDVPRPLKTPELKRRERRVQAAIAEAIGFPLAPLHEEVHEADEWMLDREAQRFMPPHWFQLAGRRLPPWDLDSLKTGAGWKWQYALRFFLADLRRLAGQVGLRRNLAWEGTPEKGAFLAPLDHEDAT